MTTFHWHACFANSALMHRDSLSLRNSHINSFQDCCCELSVLVVFSNSVPCPLLVRSGFALCRLALYRRQCQLKLNPTERGILLQRGAESGISLRRSLSTCFAALTLFCSTLTSYVSIFLTYVYLIELMSCFVAPFSQI